MTYDMMQLCRLDWQAIAILLSGIGAVGGAICIGRRHSKILGRQADIQERQAAIYDRQTEILTQQVKLQDAKLRSDLFDRRFQTYEKTISLLKATSSNRWNTQYLQMLLDDFRLVRDESKFLFDNPAVHSLLSDIYTTIDKRRLDSEYYEAVPKNQSTETDEKRQEIEKRRQEHPAWLSKIWSELQRKFASDLSILGLNAGA